MSYRPTYQASRADPPAVAPSRADGPGTDVAADGQPKSSVIRSFAPFLVLLAVLVPLDRAWLVEFLLAGLLLVLPGVLLLRALRVPGKAAAANPIYVVAASLAVLIVSGLAVDLIGQRVGVRHPLRPYPLLVGLEASCALLMYASRSAPAGVAIPWPSVKLSLRHLWPVLIPFAAALGALRLNNGHRATVAIIVAWACFATMVWAIVRAERINTAMLTFIVWAVGLAEMWSYSLRGTLVYGFDISEEYHALNVAVNSGAWGLYHPGDAYGALPSVTVLPAELHFLSGISALMVLKLLYPIVGAMLPAAAFCFGRRVVRPRWALVATSFMIAQSSFAQELSALARQEIAFIFFIAMVCVIYDKGLPRRSRWLITIVFSVGMGTSHYSTAYFAIGMLGLLLITQLVVSWFRDVPHVVGTFAIAFVAALASAVLWYGPITQSSSNVSQFVQTATNQGIDILPSSSPDQSIVSRYLSSTNTQNALSAAQYQQMVHKAYVANDKFVTPLADASAAKYDLQNAKVPKSPMRFGSLSSLVTLGQVVAGQAILFLAAAAAIFVALRRKTDSQVRQLMLLGVGAVLELGIIRISATVAAAYNQERALLQSWAILGIAMVLPLQYLCDRFKLTVKLRHGAHAVIGVTVLAIGVIYVFMSSLTATVFGGSAPAINLASSGEDYERYFTTVQETASAQWLVKQAQPGQLIYADRYAALRLYDENASVLGMINDVTPMTIDQHAWVYGSSVNIVDDRARQSFDNHLVIYKFPINFLNANFSVVYTNGASEVFHG
jgi:uncharacterized membrane protein